MNKKRKHEILGLIGIVTVVIVIIILVRVNSIKKDDVPLENQLFGSKNKYVGDASKNNKIISLLEINKFGNYTLELKTSEEPYILIINFEDAITSEAVLENYSFIILALIENLGEVQWKTPNQSLDYSVSWDEANEVFGKDVKEFANSPEDIKKLLKRISSK